MAGTKIDHSNKKNVLTKQDHIEEKRDDDSTCFDLLELSDNSSSTSSESATFSSDGPPENISDENVDSVMKAVMARSNDDTKKSCLAKSGLYKNQSVSVEDVMLLTSKDNATSSQLNNKIPRLSFNEASIKHGVSFSTPNSPQDLNREDEHQSKFHKFLHKVGLSLHTAPITNKEFDFTNRRHSSKNNHDYLQINNSSRFSNVRRSFQFGLSNSKNPEMKTDGLIGTAMQTILMDQVNIMGEILDENFLGRSCQDINRSVVSSTEFGSYDQPQPKETVLGTPFMSLADLTQACYDLQKKTIGSLQCLKEETSSELQVRPPVLRQRSFSLFDAALETMLIDKVNAVMLTPHSTPPPEPNEPLISNKHDDLLQSLPNALQKCNITHTSSASSILEEVKLNNSHLISDDYESCIGTNRSSHDIPMFSNSCSDRMGSSPVHKQQGAYHQRTESMGNKTSQSPVKHPHGLSINSSHRRSSDSDLSITPKSKYLCTIVIIYITHTHKVYNQLSVNISKQFFNK